MGTKIKVLDSTDYQLMMDAYYGTGGFKSGDYLEQHFREDKEVYNSRKKLSYYLNYTKVVVDSHVNAVFEKEAVRNYNKGSFFDQFLLNCDTQGTNFNRWMKRNATKAKLLGTSLIMVDNFKTFPGNNEQVLQQRNFPYVYVITPDRIHDWTLDKTGRLTEIVYTEKNEEDETVYKHWDFKSVWITDDKNELIGNIIDHNLDILPGFFLYGFDNPEDVVLPMSEFYQVAKTNKTIFNRCSELRELERKQAFSVLALQGNPPEKPLVLGANMALYYDTEAKNPPGYITPSVDPMNVLKQSNQENIVEIYRMACVTYTQQYASSQQSGESKKWTFHITAQVLNEFANNCELAEKKISDIFSRYIKSDVNLVSNYSRKYGVEDIDVDLDRAQKSLDLKMGGVADVEIKKQIIRQYFAEQPDKLINYICKSIDEDFQNNQNQDNEDNLNDDNQDDNSDNSDNTDLNTND